MVEEGEVFIRFSDFEKNIPYQLVIENIEQNLTYRGAFLEFRAFYPFDKGKRWFTVIFPKYKFRMSYLSLPLNIRKKVGKDYVFMEIFKRDRGYVEITRLEKYTGDNKGWEK